MGRPICAVEIPSHSFEASSSRGGLGTGAKFPPDVRGLPSIICRYNLTAIFIDKFSQSIANGDFVFYNQKPSHKGSPYKTFINRGRGHSEQARAKLVLRCRPTVASLLCWPLSLMAEGERLYLNRKAAFPPAGIRAR